MKYPLILFLAMFSISASAQIERKTENRGTDSTQTGFSKNKQSQKDRLKDLDLTKEQKEKLKEIRQFGKTAKETIENNSELSQEEKTKQLRKLQREQAQKIQGILTEEQKAKFKASKENNS